MIKFKNFINCKILLSLRTKNNNKLQYIYNFYSTKFRIEQNRTKYQREETSYDNDFKQLRIVLMKIPMRMRHALSRGFELLRRTHFLMLFMFSEKLDVTLEDRRDNQPKN